jgi:DNA repair protein RecN (Recombination protein N)
MSTSFYIKSLLIQNFATFRNQTISFRPGFNVIVGETGSGKSLVLDALQLILGSRADKRIVRRETDYSLIEAAFHCNDEKVRGFLAEEGFPFDGHELIIKRLVYKNGTSKTYINHQSCTLTFLSHFAKKYIDLVGQFENQKLLSGSYQLHLLDHFADLHSKVEEFSSLLRKYREEVKVQQELETTKQQREQRLDYLNYQLQEIEKLNPSSQDEDELLKKKNILVNLEKTQRISLQVRDIFEGSESSSGLYALCKQLSGLVAKNRDYCGNHHEAILNMEETISLLDQELSQELNQELDPSELEEVLDRLDLYQRLKKKFGGTVESILQSQVDFLKEKTQLEELELNLNGIEEKMNSLHKKLQEKGEKLHQMRSQKAKKLEEELSKRVRRLKMNNATIKIVLEKLDEFVESGITRAHFTAETNAGEGFFRIKEIASGGELSRILLSVRQILSSYDSISIFLFDEIDTGIGGETATCIGKALKEVATNGQVIAITHLPQIAQYGDSLIIVQKETQKLKSETRTESLIKEVTGKMLLKEVKAMAQLH